MVNLGDTDKELILLQMETNTLVNLRMSKRHGQGTYTCADGDKYVGEYKDGK